MSPEAPQYWLIPDAEAAVNILNSRLTTSPDIAFFTHRAIEALHAWNSAAVLAGNHDTGCFPSALAFTHGIETLEALKIDPRTTNIYDIFRVSRKVASHYHQHRTQLQPSRLTLPEFRSFLRPLKSLWVIAIKSETTGHMFAALPMATSNNLFLWDAYSNPPPYHRAGRTMQNLEVVTPAVLFHHIKLHHTHRHLPVALIGFS